MCIVWPVRVRVSAGMYWMRKKGIGISAAKLHNMCVDMNQLVHVSVSDTPSTLWTF